MAKTRAVLEAVPAKEQAEQLEDGAGGADVKQDGPAAGKTSDDPIEDIEPITEQ